MRGIRTAWLLAPILGIGCAANPDRHTLAELRDVRPEVTEVQLENSLEQAISAYGRFLEEAPKSALTPEAMRRLADLKLEKEYGVLGEEGVIELPAAESMGARADARGRTPEPPADRLRSEQSESEEDFERRATGPQRVTSSDEPFPLEFPGRPATVPTAPEEAIEIYDQILAAYPNYPLNDQVLYQKARAYDELGRSEDAMEVMKRLVAEYPNSRHIDEVQFRRAEYFFMRKKYLDAEDAYRSIIDRGTASEYYELALYKLGWTFYKQELHEEALDSYVTLLDYKLAVGYDFEQPDDEDEERRIADTYRVISLCFSNLGGPEVVGSYFSLNGQRSYEDRIYDHLGDFYLEKLRYADAAGSYAAFIELYPLHRSAPPFGMRIIEIYEAGGFPKLVLESRKEFAASYGLQSEYWDHFDPDESPEVLSYLRANLEDLAAHYHAAYQETEDLDEKSGHFEEALRWYRAYLSSFPAEESTPSIHYRLADLLLEHGDFPEAAREYERTAYDYPVHEQAPAAGYAAIYAHRQNLTRAVDAARAEARREAIASTLRFVDTFPRHEHAAASLGAAVEDMYVMKEFGEALANARRLIDEYAEADLPVLRSAWEVLAHSSFETADYPEAERAYARVLEMTPADDDSRRAVTENLAAAIYKQGEQANLDGEFRSAADHFLRVARVAPASDVRPLAEYDAGAALARLEDWSGAAEVLESFREAYPDHELRKEATKQLAYIYREAGDAPRAGTEYERVASETEDPEARREALLVAGELYENEALPERAVAVYREYVKEFPDPLEPAVETRFKLAKILEEKGDEESRRAELRRIVEIDGAAAGERTPRIQYLAAQSALALSQELYDRFDEIELVQPLEGNLREKEGRMDAALEEFGRLVDYEIAEVTAAATFYIAEIYSEFGKGLMTSERPAGLSAAEMQQYEAALEEEAFPFEEKAIEIHSKNLELMAAGIYNAWIDRSLARLADLVPGQYAKFETSSGLIAAIDRYVYEAPSALGSEAPQRLSIEPSPGAPLRVPDAVEAPEVEPSLPAAPAKGFQLPDGKESGGPKTRPESQSQVGQQEAGHAAPR